MKYNIEIGISKPDLAPGRKETHLTVPEMRALIYEAACKSSALVRNCLNLSQTSGLTGEDTMTLIAYHALRLLQDHNDTMLRHADLSPIPNIILKTGDVEPPPSTSGV